MIALTVAVIISSVLLLVSDILPWKMYIKIAAIVTAVLCSSLIGHRVSETARKAELNNLQLELAKQKEESLHVNERVVEKLIPTIKYVEKIKTVEVEKFIPTDSTINHGFVALHDQVVGEGSIIVPLNPDASSGNGIRDVASVVTQNYAMCIETGRRLELLQEWINEQRRIYK